MKGFVAMQGKEIDFVSVMFADYDWEQNETRSHHAARFPRFYFFLPLSPSPGHEQASSARHTK